MKEVNFVNCTPHELNVYCDNEVLFDIKTRSYYPITTAPKVKIIPASGIVPRCSQTDELKSVEGGIPIYKTVFGSVENLPEPKENTYYIVSQIVANAVKYRKDLLIPVRMVRNCENKIVGCLGFAINE